MNCNNKITLTLFVCLFIVFLFIVLKWIYNLTIFNMYEYFNNKRNTKIKIYQSDEILDPDENTLYDEDDTDADT